MEHQTLTRQAWLETIQHWVEKTVMGESEAAPAVVPWWVETREIRIMWESGIAETTVRAVQDAIEEHIAGVNLPVRFTVELLGDRWSEGGKTIAVSNYIRPAMVAGCVDHRRLFKLSYHESYRQVRQHADMYITTRSFLNDSTSWGAASFEYGCGMLMLYGNRQRQLPFLRNVVKHEMTHMLGMPIHCDDLGVAGMTYDPNCNMHYTVPSGQLCLKCSLFLNEWWRHLTR